ncbi:hypothetical protein UPTC5083_01108 [Campylobacter lari]|uniref:Flagellar biosynthesis protein n=2 Tax=Campylobacter lari TaxID=201 RepID=A0A5L4JSA5_CAMLA|nr:hypothetical protein [Campylobacter lari]AJD02182.1 hypothetical protein UPTC3659_1349 [Campylobacter lari NCTC 11845]AJD03659.1 hypothetical protein UPTC4110_1116 [Campylobacter lari CCUG 22395]AJD05140.1 hypothetical protein UPTC16701_1106 [Campylobacter lari RM16701]AJD06641.1 hypothetical protein UPTC16712_1137 [Campylobacter lari RM16712]AKJ53859.1 hypothetical protein CD56_05835 [Campylobacter lari]
MAFLNWAILILFLFIVFLLINRYERKMKILYKNIEILKNECKKNSENIEQNRILIEKNRSKIEDIKNQD